jgi:Uma2 family endonuclease
MSSLTSVQARRRESGLGFPEPGKRYIEFRPWGAFDMAIADLLPAEVAEDDFAEDGVDAVAVHTWTRENYERMAELGFFQDRRVELVDGVVYEFMTPQLSPHATGVQKGLRALRASFPADCDIRSQLPLILGLKSMPESDLAVVVGEPDDYLRSHPSTAVLIVEIADSSQIHDRKRKAKVYAAAEIADYWIVNLRLDAVEVFRDPREGSYSSRQIYRRGAAISPVARPEASVAVDDLLPRHEPAS